MLENSNEQSGSDESVSGHTKKKSRKSSGRRKKRKIGKQREFQKILVIF